MEHPLVLIEVLSPTDVSRTPPDGAWQLQPDVQGPDGELRLDSIGFATPLREVYRTSGLT